MSDTGTARDGRVQWFVGAVACVALVVLAIAVRDVATHPLPQVWMLVGFAALQAIAVYAPIEIRFGSNRMLMSWTDFALLVGITLLPTGWIIVTALVGIAAVKLIQRAAVLKTVFNVAKTLIATSVAAAAAHAISPDGRWLVSWHGLIGLLVAAVLFAGINDVSVAVVASLASGRPIRQMLSLAGTPYWISLFGNLSAALATIAFLSIDERMLVAIPPLVLSLHLVYASRLRARTERENWQRIASATDRFSAVDLEAVLRAAITSAAELFSADEVEIAVRLGAEAPGLVRGSAKGVTWAGQQAEAPDAQEMETIAVPIGRQHSPEPERPNRARGRWFSRGGTGITSSPEVAATGGGSRDDDSESGGDADGAAEVDLVGGQVGELRLRFGGTVRLNEREQYALRTFAASLGTALRNAYAYAESQQAAARHAYDAAHDPLTGLPNRRHLLSHGEEVMSARPIRGIHALVLIDLDHFKEVNDTLGHSAGDQVLTTVGKRLATAAGPEDIVVRLGGDEFAVLFVALQAPALAMHRARQMLATLDPPIEVDGIRIHAAGSGGVAIAPAQGGVAELLRRADVAMYQAKREGLRITQYARSRDTADVSRLALGGDLRAALDEGQFAVHFQPLVDLATGRALGAEALTRWRHPYRGNLNPQRFLSAIERSGMLPAFAEVVLTEALTAAQNWRAAGHQVGVSINVSPRSLLDPTYPQQVEARLRDFDVPAEVVTLELTETLTLSRLDVVDEVLSALRELGLRIALDDFGTGYSSLSMLARVPVHELKVDRAFVSGMTTSAESAAVVRSTIDLGRSLDLDVVAEGVESPQQRGLLFELGCPIGQGHLFSRPVSAERFTSMLATDGGLAPPLSSDAQVIRIPPARLVRGNRHRL